MMPNSGKILYTILLCSSLCTKHFAAERPNQPNQAQQLIGLFIGQQQTMLASLGKLAEALNPRGNGLAIDTESFFNLGDALAQGVNRGGGLLNINLAGDFGGRLQDMISGRNMDKGLGKILNKELGDLLRGENQEDGLGYFLYEQIVKSFEGNDQAKDLGSRIRKQIIKALKGKNSEGDEDDEDGGIGDIFGKQFTDLTDAIRKGIDGLGGNFAKEINKGADEANDQLSQAILALTKKMDEIADKIQKYIHWIVGWGIGGALFMISSLAVAGWAFVMLVYYKIKNYLFTPSIAHETSSRINIFKITRFSSKQIMQEIRQGLVLNAKEIEAIKTYVDEVEMSLQHKLPLPNLLLVGMPGTGKTKIAAIIAKYFKRYMFLSGSSFMKFNDGESLVQMDSVFSWQKKKLINLYTSSLIFIDEIEFFLGNRNNQNDKNRLVFQHFLNYTGTPSYSGIIIGASNDPSIIDPAIHRRFPTIIKLESPDLDSRATIFKRYFEANLKRRKLDYAAYRQIAVRLKNATGADVENIVKKITARVLKTGQFAHWIIDEEIEAYHERKQNLTKSYL